MERSARTAYARPRLVNQSAKPVGGIAACLICRKRGLRDRSSLSPASASVQITGDLVDAGFCAGAILLAAGHTGNADCTDQVLAGKNRQRTIKRADLVEEHPRLVFVFRRFFAQPDLRLCGDVAAFMKTGLAKLKRVVELSGARVD